MTRVVLYSDAPVVGGGERFARDLLAALDPSYEPVVVGIHPEVVAHVAGGRPGMRAEVLPAVRGRGDVASLLAQARLIRGLDADVVHVNRHLYSGQYGVLAAALAGVPSLCVVHGALPPSGRGQRQLTMAVDRLTARFVGVSHHVSAQIRVQLHVAPQKVRTIYDGIAAATPAGPEGARPEVMAGTVMGVGRLAHEKGFDVLVEAMADLPGRRLVLVGDGPERARLEALAGRLGVADRVRFAGWVSEPWAVRFRPEIVVVPSRFEALSLVALEAMRAGIPVVATRVGGIPEVVVDQVTGVLADPEQPAALAKAIDGLLAAPARRAELAAAGLRRLEARFSHEAMRAAYEALYDELAAAPSGRPGDDTNDAPGGGGRAPLFGPLPGSHPRLRALAQVLPPEAREWAKVAGGRVARRVGRPAAAGGPGPVVAGHVDGLRGRVLVVGDVSLAGLVEWSFREVDELIVCDLEPRNLAASLMADPSEAGSLEAAAYDGAFVVGVGWSPEAAGPVLANCWQALRPGGTLLVAVPPPAPGGAGLTGDALAGLLDAHRPAGGVELLATAPGWVGALARKEPS